VPHGYRKSGKSGPSDAYGAGVADGSIASCKRKFQRVVLGLLSGFVDGMTSIPLSMSLLG
jgi:hypothetical protein